jgi:UDP-N-acetylmuramoylalanine--D-glutamate ligase
MVAITGSNGKTTTTSLTAHLIRAGGRDMVVAGNIGEPLADFVDEIDDDTVVVLEVSSFQLDHVETFRPAVSVLLNVTPDHLDRYEHDFDKYAASKFRVFENQRAGDWLVYNADDPVVAAKVDALPAGGPERMAMSIEGPVARGGYVRWDTPGRAGRIVLALPEAGRTASNSPIHEEDLMSSSDLALRGRHNLYNSLAAAIAARAMEIRSDVVRQSLASFEGVPHRLEKIRTVNDVTFVNDSKATNVNAVWYALESFDGNIVLIAGGRDKGNDYGPLRKLVEDKVKGVVAIGESAEKVLAELGPFTAHTARATSMEEAVQYARLMAEAGDVVLLSPACASFDMFKNYEDRGDTFRDLVMAL